MRSIPFFDDHYPVRTVFTGKKDIHQCDGRDVPPDVEEFSAFMNMPLRRMLFAKEAHSGSVCVVTEQDPEGGFVYTDETWSVKPPGGYDSVITDIPEILLCLRTADCIPVFLYDPAGRVIAMAHSGWRGTCSGISVNTVCAMEKLFGTDPGQVIAAFGPCVCGNCYEVGPELIEDFSKRFSADERRIFFRPKGKDKYHLDVKGAVRTDLLRLGVKPENMYDTGICTYENDGFASYRRDGWAPPEKQMISGIALKNENR